jgi:signal transduction histidine kinase
MPTKATLRTTETDELYATALTAYLQLGGEDSLHRGYELGRRAVREGRSILQMIDLHQRVVAQVLTSANSSDEAARAVEAASAFFGEAMSSYEMTNRAFSEANAALEHVNELLESEVKRIAHRLHDGAGQLLAAAHMKLEDVSHDLPAHARERLQEVRGILDQLETELRGLSHELRPPTLEVQGLAAALQALAAAVSRRSGLRVIVENTEPLQLSSKTQVVLYRVIQEALKNVAKHAQARCAMVSLSLQEGFVRCSIEDDGIGFDKDALSAGRGLGLLCIRERLQAVRGSLEIQTAVGLGSTLNVRIPCEME